MAITRSELLVGQLRRPFAGGRLQSPPLLEGGACTPTVQPPIAHAPLAARDQAIKI